jgi:hypothetical protein
VRQEVTEVRHQVAVAMDNTTGGKDKRTLLIDVVAHVLVGLLDLFRGLDALEHRD